MTANQIKKALTKANVNIEGLEFDRDSVEICLGYTESNSSGRAIGNCDEELVEARRKEIVSAIPEFNGGFYTQYGACILQIGYVSKGDWNDPSSAHHY